MALSILLRSAMLAFCGSEARTLNRYFTLVWLEIVKLSTSHLSSHALLSREHQGTQVGV